MKEMVRYASLASLFAVMFTSAGAWAGECAQDSDCGAGYTCVKGVSVPGCEDPSAGCPPNEPVVAEVGYCEKAPIACATDADCPDFLRCADEATVCWGGSDGQSGCSEPDPAKRTCQFQPIECNTNSDCPSDFECTNVPVPCPAIDCYGPDTDCESTCDETQNLCTPKVIGCAQNTDCPSNWTCENTSSPNCMSPDSTEGSANYSPANSPACALPPEPAICSPSEYYTGSSNSGGQLATGEGAPGNSKGSGCAVSPQSSGNGLSGLALLGLALFGLGRRRRRAA